MLLDQNFDKGFPNWLFIEKRKCSHNELNRYLYYFPLYHGLFPSLTEMVLIPFYLKPGMHRLNHGTAQHRSIILDLTLTFYIKP